LPVFGETAKHAKSDISLPTITMPIAPIVGKLRKRFFIDLTCSLGLGISGGYAYWSVCLLFCALFIMLNPSSGMATILRLVSLRCGLSMQSGTHVGVFSVERQENFYLKLEREKVQAAGAS